MIISPQKFKAFISILDLSLESANSLYGWSNGALIVGSVLVLLGTIGAFWGSAIRDRYAELRISNNEMVSAKANENARLLELELAKTNERAANAEIRISEANRNVEEARRDTAKHELQLVEQRKLLAAASERVATAELRATEAKLELERFKAPRTMLPEQVESFITEMSHFKGQRVLLGATSHNFEVVSFGSQIFDLLKRAGVKVEANPAFVGRVLGIVRGVVSKYTTGNDKSHLFAVALTQALKDRGIHAGFIGGLDEELVPRMEKEYGYERNGEHFEHVAVGIGEKP